MPTVNPGKFFSIRNAVIPRYPASGSALAKSRNRPIAVQSATGFCAKIRHSASYTNQPATIEPRLIAIASGTVNASTSLSIRNVEAPAQYTIASIAIPESHVEYASQ